VPKKHKCPEPEPDNTKAWLDSYADAMTLLLAFFILLFAFSLVDQKKFQEFKAGLYLAAGKAAPALDGGSGVLDLGTGISDLVVSLPVVADGEKADIPPEHEEHEEPNGDIGDGESAELYERLAEQIEAIGATEFVELERSDAGVVVRMDSRVLYQSGSALIVPDGVAVLESLQPVLASIDNLVIVEGHTDSQPTNGGGGFPTNWELSAARAVSVLRYLTEFTGLPPARLSASGFADTRPRATNDTPEGREINRRVELVVLVEDDQINVIEQLVSPDDGSSDAGTSDSAESEEDAVQPGPSLGPAPVDLTPNI